MVALYTPDCQIDLAAPDFNLLDTHGKQWRLQDCTGEKGLVVMFICNHCPYVKAILPELVADMKALQSFGVNSVAIMSNDVSNYPEDAPKKMQELALQFAFPFPYLYDATQEVAHAYDAVCTPDFFGYNSDNLLQYRGRFDASGINRVEPREEPELFNAMKEIAQSGKGPAVQHPSIGCSLKWFS